MSVCIIEVGFCDEETEKTIHGTYTWAETQVGLQNYQTCEFNEKLEYDPPGLASRYCKSPYEWMEYMPGNCISETTYQLSTLAEV